MPSDCVTYQESGYFSNLIVDYLNQKEEIQSLYHRFPTLENFKIQIEEKQKNFSSQSRLILQKELLQQNASIALSESSTKNIQLLSQDNTFTVTTGHQLSLFTGPLYFIYKIVSTINLCKELQQQYPQYHFVPVYWMATEDHDFEEINHFSWKGKKIVWHKNSNGPVGRLSTEELQEVYNAFAYGLGLGENATYLKEIFQKAYLEHATLSEATRYLVNALFKEEGLVIIDGDAVALKQEFIPYLKAELTAQNSYKKVTETLQHFPYTAQVNPRETNLFYIEKDSRERIVFKNNTYSINNTNISFTTDEILELVEKSPEKFSPNVILRPLYQEVILPNLCYIGGGGEIAYWLELKAMFDYYKVTFPILLLRNSVLVATQKEVRKMEQLGLSWRDLFWNRKKLIDQKTKDISNFTIDFSEQKKHLAQQFYQLKEMAIQTDVTFSKAVEAQEKKQIKGLENLEKRLLKAEKKKWNNELERIMAIQEALFPNQSLQERQLNFSEFYMENPNFITLVLSQLKPLKTEFTSIIV